MDGAAVDNSDDDTLEAAVALVPSVDAVEAARGIENFENGLCWHIVAELLRKTDAVHINDVAFCKSNSSSNLTDRCFIFDIWGMVGCDAVFVAGRTSRSKCLTKAPYL